MASSKSRYSTTSTIPTQASTTRRITQTTSCNYKFPLPSATSLVSRTNRWCKQCLRVRMASREKWRDLRLGVACSTSRFYTTSKLLCTSPPLRIRFIKICQSISSGRSWMSWWTGRQLNRHQACLHSSKCSLRLINKVLTIRRRMRMDKMGRLIRIRRIIRNPRWMIPITGWCRRLLLYPTRIAIISCISATKLAVILQIQTVRVQLMIMVLLKIKKMSAASTKILIMMRMLSFRKRNCNGVLKIKIIRMLWIYALTRLQTWLAGQLMSCRNSRTSSTVWLPLSTRFWTRIRRIHPWMMTKMKWTEQGLSSLIPLTKSLTRISSFEWWGLTMRKKKTGTMSSHR